MIRLRPVEREDLKQLRDWRNDDEIFSRVREYRLLNMENQQAWFDSLRDDRKIIMFGVEWHSNELNSGPQFIGVCGLTNIDWVVRKAEISIYIGDFTWRRKGLGKDILRQIADYAFEECNLNRLWAEVFSNNLISQKLFLRAGYKEEGILKAHAFKGGKYLDSHIYGLLREDFCAT